MADSSNLLPPNSTSTETRLAQAIAALGDLPVDIRSVRNPQTCPAHMLPWLAWDFSVDAWDTNWTEAQKRSVIAASIRVHRRKGTVGALKAAVSALGYDEIQVIEWFQITPQGDPYTFSVRVVVDQTGVSSSADFDQIAMVVNSAKNTRSHMTGMDMLGVSNLNAYCGAVTLIGETVSIGIGD
jgi:phage tail P2-like protein